MTLEPRLIISGGMPAAGKTTTCEEITRRFHNVVYLDRDTIISGGLLYFNPAKGEGLLSGRQYLGSEPFTEVETPFGRMLKMGWDLGYYYRHAEWPSRMAIGHQAAQALRLGKAPIFDCFLAEDVNNGTVERFMSWDLFTGYPIYLIYFVVETEMCKNRLFSRATVDEEARRRTEILEAKFEEELRLRHTLSREGEAFVRQFGKLIDTTDRSVDDCVEECLKYIKDEC